MACCHFSVTYERFFASILLKTPLIAGSITLEDCLDLFIARTTAKHVCKTETKRKHTEAETIIFFAEMPQHLFIQIDHSGEGTTNLSSLSTNLKVPTEPIDLSQWSQRILSGKGPSCWYEICAVIRRSLTE